MLNLFSITPYDGEVLTLKLKNDPTRGSLGYYEDEKNMLWDVAGIIHKGNIKQVMARPVDNSSIYRTDGSPMYGSYTWLPYNVEVIK